MSDEAAVALRCGRLQLVLGSEIGITAMEVVTTGDQTHLDLNDLRGTAHQLVAHGASAWPEALFIVDSDAPESPEVLKGEVTIDTYGANDVPATARIRELGPNVWMGILVEAAFAAWRQRLSDAADALSQLTSAEARIVGPLDIPGRPVLTELRAERRRALHSGVALVRPNSNVETTVDEVIVDLRAAVRFRAAGFAEATNGLLGEAIQPARGHGGLCDRLRLLLAAEEICAIELLASAGNRLASVGADDSGSDIFSELLAQYVFERQQAEELAVLLDDVVGRLPPARDRLAKRLVRRKTHRDALTLRETAEAYSGVLMNAARSRESGATTWDEAAHALGEMDLVTAAASAESMAHDPSFDSQAAQSVDDAAELLGELFAQQLPVARALVNDLTRQHPGFDNGRLVQIVKRQTVQKLAGQSRRYDSTQPVQETVAVLAMAIALLRGIEPHTEAEFQEMGRRILASAHRIANFRAQAGTALPAVFAGFGRFARRVQPAVVEFVFHAMAGAKPGGTGPARDLYKKLRSKVWRARYDRKVFHAAAGGASKALLKAIDAGAPRLIVRYVDRSLPAPNR
jgi:hypothetical protein